MKINKIKQRIDDLKEDNYLFYLTECRFENGSLEEIIETIALEEGKNELIISSPYSTLLTDKEGNVLKDLSEGNSEKSYEIINVKGNDIIITDYQYNQGKNGKPILKKIRVSKYILENGKLKVQLELQKEPNCTGINIKVVDDDTLLIEVKTRTKREAFLYSISKKEEITPVFSKLEETENKNIFRFTDTVESNETIDGKKERANIIGFITKDGVFGDEIFDETINDKRQIDLNTHPDFMQYRSLRHMLSIKLDSIVEEKINKKHSQNQIIKGMEYKLNNKY